MNKPKNNNYYYDVPKGYILDLVFDAKKKKTAVIITIINIIIFILTCLPFYNMISDSLEIVLTDNDTTKLFIVYLVFILSMLVYIVLHELTHGLCYKILTHEKLTYGFTLTVAYCGVPKLYVTKKTALISILAPLVVFTIILLPIIFLVDAYYQVFLIFLFAIHFSGCIGDMYDALIIIFKYKGKEILMNDTGPTQKFYVKK